MSEFPPPVNAVQSLSRSRVISSSRLPTAKAEPLGHRQAMSTKHISGMIERVCVEKWEQSRQAGGRTTDIDTSNERSGYEHCDHCATISWGKGNSSCVTNNTSCQYENRDLYYFRTFAQSRDENLLTTWEVRKGS